MVTGTDYREEAAQDAFPKIKQLGVKVKIRENADAWVVNASDLEKALQNLDMPNRTSKYWVIAELLILGAFALYSFYNR
jgi:hypothetical protein